MNRRTKWDIRVRTSSVPLSTVESGLMPAEFISGKHRDTPPCFVRPPSSPRFSDPHVPRAKQIKVVAYPPNPQNHLHPSNTNVQNLLQSSTTSLATRPSPNQPRHHGLSTRSLARSTRQNQPMADPINTFRTPLYGDKDAKLHNFRQKQRPPRAFLELVNDDKKVGMRIFSVPAQPYIWSCLTVNGILSRKRRALGGVGRTCPTTLGQSEARVLEPERAQKGEEGGSSERGHVEETTGEGEGEFSFLLSWASY